MWYWARETLRRHQVGLAQGVPTRCLVPNFPKGNYICGHPSRVESGSRSDEPRVARLPELRRVRQDGNGSIRGHVVVSPRSLLCNKFSDLSPRKSIRRASPYEVIPSEGWLAVARARNPPPRNECRDVASGVVGHTYSWGLTRLSGEYYPIIVTPWCVGVVYPMR